MGVSFALLKMNYLRGPNLPVSLLAVLPNLRRPLDIRLLA